jgi:hypothetical protein
MGWTGGNNIVRRTAEEIEKAMQTVDRDCCNGHDDVGEAVEDVARAALTELVDACRDADADCLEEEEGITALLDEVLKASGVLDPEED